MQPGSAQLPAGQTRAIPLIARGHGKARQARQGTPPTPSTTQARKAGADRWPPLVASSFPRGRLGSPVMRHRRVRKSVPGHQLQATSRHMYTQKHKRKGIHKLSEQGQRRHVASKCGTSEADVEEQDGKGQKVQLPHMAYMGAAGTNVDQPEPAAPDGLPPGPLPPKLPS